MNEGENTFIWKSNIAPVAAGVPIENDLLFQILSFLDDKNSSGSTTISWNDFSQHFREIEKDKLLNHANYAFEMNYIHHNIKFNIKSDRKYHDVRGDIDDITPIGRDYIEYFQRRRRERRNARFISIFKPLGLVMFGAVAGVYAREIVTLLNQLFGVLPWK